MSRDLVIALVCTVAVASALRAQTPSDPPPDFNGRWILDDPSQRAADVAGALNVRTSAGPPQQITISREFETDTRTTTYPIGVMSGITTGVAPGSNMPRAASEYFVRWFGDQLVFHTRNSQRDDQQNVSFNERNEAWSLADGKLTVSVTHVSSSGERSDQTLTYRKP